MSDTPRRTEEELEQILLGKENRLELMKIVETIIVWMIITGLVIGGYFFLPQNFRYYLFGPGTFFNIFMVSAIFTLFLFVVNYSVGAGAGFNTATLILSPEALEVEYKERLRMWDTTWGMVGAFLVTIITLIIYLVSRYFV